MKRSCGDMIIENNKNKNTIININAGGIIISTYLSTITKYKDSVIATMFNNNHIESIELDKDNNYFIDTDGLLFSHIIHYIRRSTPFNIIPLNITEELWKNEIDYWGLPYPKEEIDIIEIKQESIQEIVKYNINESDRIMNEMFILLFKLSDSNEKIKKGIISFNIYIPCSVYMTEYGYLDRYFLNSGKKIMDMFSDRFKLKNEFYITYNGISYSSKAVSKRIDYIFNTFKYNTLDNTTLEISIHL